MLKYILLIIFFMAMVFASIATIMPNASPGSAQMAEIGKEITKPLAKVDDLGSEISNLAPDLSGALENVKLSVLTKSDEKKEPEDIHVLGDHSGAVFSNKDMPQANFASSLIAAAAFDGALLNGVVLEGANGEDANFFGAHMSKANMSAAFLPKADFSNAELREAIARGGSFGDAKFTNADISFASFSGATLIGADFRKAYGAGAFFVGADLSKAKFTGADLTGVRLAQANLEGAIFEAADMALVDLTGANIHGADLSGAINLTPEQIAGACSNGATKLPEGMAATRC